MDFIQIILVLALFVAIIIPTSKYMYHIMNFEKTASDPFFDKVDGFIYKITGIKNEDMTWKKYAMALIITNAIMTLFVYLIFRIQGVLGFNPNGIKAMEESLTFNTAISFITNTNLQDYAGESGLSYLSQMTGITFLMFTSGATGVAAAFAFIRGIAGKKNGMGNYFIDMVRITTRILIPFSLFVAIILMSQGVPQTLMQNQTVATIEGKMQDIPLGPIASLEAIKHIGTNGGGFFGANSSHPFENPNPITNVVEMLSMMVIPGALVFAYGRMVKNRKEGRVIFATMAVLFIAALFICVGAEKAGNPGIAQININQNMGNMEGKEMRFGAIQSALFATVTTSFTTGSVDCMHDSLTPLGGLVPMWNMMLNCVFGGEGAGIMNMLMYAILAVFLCGLMVGRTPEFLGKKLEGKEVKLIALCILIHPFLILIASAISVVSKAGVAGISNPGFHGLSQVLYQYASSSANNGSGFEGMADNTMFWNTSAGIVMILGRFLSIVILLAVASSLAQKTAVPEGPGTFKTDNAQFIIILVFIVIIVGALTFFPAIALGPIAEHLTLLR